LVLGTCHGTVGGGRLGAPTVKREERVLPGAKLLASVITLGPVFSRLFSSRGELEENFKLELIFGM